MSVQCKCNCVRITCRTSPYTIAQRPSTLPSTEWAERWALKTCSKPCLESQVPDTEMEANQIYWRSCYWKILNSGTSHRNFDNCLLSYFLWVDRQKFFCPKHLSISFSTVYSHTLINRPSIYCFPWFTVLFFYHWNTICYF